MRRQDKLLQAITSCLAKKAEYMHLSDNTGICHILTLCKSDKLKTENYCKLTILFFLLKISLTISVFVVK